MKIPEEKQYKHKTLFHYYYQDLNGNWTRCRRFSLRDKWHELSYGDELPGDHTYERNTPFTHYRRETQLSGRDFILKRVLVPVYIMIFIIAALMICYLLTEVI